MPYVNVRLVGKLTKDQKQKIAQEISETLLKVANKPKNATYIAFDELPGENWAVGDKLLG
jgi:4-oxalocrotonate tautomerase